MFTGATPLYQICTLYLFKGQIAWWTCNAEKGCYGQDVWDMLPGNLTAASSR